MGHLGRQTLTQFMHKHARKEFNSRVFLLRQLWIVTYCVQSWSNNLSNTGVSDVFKTKHELKCQNELFMKYNFSENTSFYVFITEII